jgi:hypothetical protein
MIVRELPATNQDKALAGPFSVTTVTVVDRCDNSAELASVTPAATLPTSTSRHAVV